MRNTCKSKQDEEGLGRSCGGFSTKIHAVCDALGNPLRFIITAGQRHDVSQAIAIVSGLKAQNLLADKGYDSDELREFVESCGCQAQIPPRKNRLEERSYDEHLYEERHKVECLFGFLKHYRRLFSRFDKTKQNFTAFLHFIAALHWLK